MLLISFLFVGQIRAEIKKLNIDDAIKTALNNSFDAKTAKLSTQKAEAAVDEAFGNALPSLSISGQYTRNLQSPVFFMPNFFQNKMNETIAVKIGSDNAFQAAASVTQILFNSAVFTAVGTSKIYADASRDQRAGTFSKTIASVKKAFYGVLLAKEFSEAIQTSFKNANDNLKSVKALFDEGMIAEYDKIRAEVGVENIRPMMLQADAALANARNGLKMVLGVDMKDSIEVIGELAPPKDDIEIDENKALSTLTESNFDLQSLEKLKRVNQDIVSMRRSEYYPTIALFGNYVYQGQSNTFDFQTAKSSAVGINLSLSLFQGFQSNARVQQAQIDYETTDVRAKQLEEGLKMQLKNTLLQLKIAKSKMEAQSKTVSQAERGYEIALIRYKEGIGSQMEINDADNALVQSKVNKAQSVYEYISSLADYENLLGIMNNKYFTSK